MTDHIPFGAQPDPLPATNEPVAWIDPRTIAYLQERKRWATAILTVDPGENATMPLYAAPAEPVAVTDEMVERAHALIWPATEWNEGEYACRDVVRAALTAALEPKP